MLSLDNGFKLPLGRYLAEREQSYFDREVGDIFGFNAVQVGLEQFDFLHTNRMPLRLRSGIKAPANCAPQPTLLPIAGHPLTCGHAACTGIFQPATSDLREAERVLMPEGQLIVTDLIRVSLWGFNRASIVRVITPGAAILIALSRLKDWLALLVSKLYRGKCAVSAPAKQ